MYYLLNEDRDHAYCSSMTSVLSGAAFALSIWTIIYCYHLNKQQHILFPTYAVVSAVLISVAGFIIILSIDTSSEDYDQMAMSRKMVAELLGAGMVAAGPVGIIWAASTSSGDGRMTVSGAGVLLAASCYAFKYARA